MTTPNDHNELLALVKRLFPTSSPVVKQEKTEDIHIAFSVEFFPFESTPRPGWTKVDHLFEITCNPSGWHHTTGLHLFQSQLGDFNEIYKTEEELKAGVQTRLDKLINTHGKLYERAKTKYDDLVKIRETIANQDDIDDNMDWLEELNIIAQTPAIFKEKVSFYLTKRKKQVVNATELSKMIKGILMGLDTWKPVSVYGVKINSDKLPDHEKEIMAEQAWVFGWGNDQDTGEIKPILWQRGYKAESTNGFTNEDEAIQLMLEGLLL